MIRFAACAFLAVLVSLPSMASDWHRYINPRYGAAVDVPGGFTAQGPAPVPGDGMVFRASHGRAALTVWGAQRQADDFMAEVRARIREQETEGWSITYRSETPDWAAWSGTRAGHVFYAKAISSCSGQQTANVRLDYPAMDITAFDAVVNRLGQSLAQDGACY